MSDHITPVNIEDMREQGVYLGVYQKHRGVKKGHYPFTVTKLGRHHIHVMFYYPVRNTRGNERLIGDEPAILMQTPKTRLWKHFGATIGDVPMQVGMLEGKRLAKHNAEQAFRREWLKTHTLPRTDYPMGSDHIAGIIRRIEDQARAEERE